MSKVNVDEIQVGDLVEYTFEDDKCLGYVIELYNGGLRAFWSDFLSEYNEDFENQSITGHWKVINFEEESKMNDELKVYTGKDTLQALLEGKVLKRQDTKGEYRFNDGQLQFYTNGKFCKIDTSFTDVYNVKFTEVVLPQVGDWVKACDKLGFTSTGLITSVTPDRLYGNWNGDKGETYYLNSDIVSWEILSSEQVSEYKREQAFAKVGRKLNEFKPEDIVYVESLEKVMIVISKINTDKVMLREINYIGSGRHAARPHQLKPICFVENQVDLS